MRVSWRDPDVQKILLAMRLTLFLMVISVFSVYSSTYAQKTKLNLKVQNSQVKEVLNEIENQSEFFFMYDNKQVDVERRVNVEASSQTIEQVLQKLFDGTSINYKVVNRQVLLFPENKNVGLSEQSVKISGKVTDSTGSSLPGVSVLVKGTSNGYITDANGNYSISNVPANGTLVFSFVGMKTQAITVSGRLTLNVVLAEDAIGLEEVVAIGYGTQKKSDLSGALSTVSSKIIGNRPIMSVGQALQGAVANLTVSVGNGRANSSPGYNIRGFTSINGGSPLIVIDGITADQDRLSAMNPADIENITVLKDAASSAIYGSRAAYGVILVTTKNGNDKTTFEYSNNVSFRTPTFKPQYLLDPGQVAKDLNTMASLYGVIYTQQALDYAASRSKDPSLAPILLDPSGNSWVGLGNTNWYDEIFKDHGTSTQHNLSVSGKTDKISYLVSGGFLYNNGLTKPANDTYRKYNLLMKLNMKINDWWSLSNITSFVRDTYDRPNALSDDAFYFYPTTQGTLEVPRTPNGNYTGSGAQTIGKLIDGGRSNSLNGKYQTQFETKLDILKDVLSIQGHFSYCRINNLTKNFSLRVPYEVGPNHIEMWGSNSSAMRNTELSEQYYEDVYANFNKTYAGKHALSATLGFNQEKFNTDYISITRLDLTSGSYPTIQLANGTISAYESAPSWAMRSAFGRLTYIFDQKYIVAFNGRYDGTSRFPKNDRFVFNPSASGAWVISNEKFFEPVHKIIDYLKLRLSYGTLGNQNVDYFAYLPTMNSSRVGVILDGARPNYVTTPGLVAGDLTWEKVTTRNIGFDINFLQNRFSLNGDVYQRDTKGMLSKGQVLPSVLGASQPLVNAAELRTKGWELNVSWNDDFVLLNKSFKYHASVVLSDNTAKITKYNNPTGTLSDYFEGQKIGDVWGLTTEGFFTSADDIAQHANQSQVTKRIGVTPIQPGDLKFLDRNGDKVISRGQWTVNDHGDYSVIGNSSPRYSFGITLSAEWNNFDVSMFFQGVGKKNYYPRTDGMTTDYTFFSLYASPWAMETKGFTNHWTADNPNAYFPRMKPQIAESSSYDLGIPQTRYLQDASYIRLKNLTLGYSLPRLTIKKLNIEKVRVFFSAENPWTKSGLIKDFSVDPELVGAGGGGLAYSIQKAYSLGLNLTF